MWDGEIKRKKVGEEKRRKKGGGKRKSGENEGK